MSIHAKCKRVSFILRCTLVYTDQFKKASVQSGVRSESTTAGKRVSDKHPTSQNSPENAQWGAGRWCGDKTWHGHHVRCRRHAPEKITSSFSLYLFGFFVVYFVLLSMKSTLIRPFCRHGWRSVCQGGQVLTTSAHLRVHSPDRKGREGWGRREGGGGEQKDEVSDCTVRKMAFSPKSH